MAIKELQTRIALKYDSYENWADTSKEGLGANLVLLKGELGICEVKATNSDIKDGSTGFLPTVLFKVGDGESKFSALPWASAKAADVYSWAKASNVERQGKKLVFIGGKADGSNLEVEFDYVTLTEVKAITDPLATRVLALEAALDLDNGAEGSISSQISNINEQLEDITGEGGAIATAKQAAIDAAAADATTKADAAEANAIAKANELNTAMDTRVDTLEGDNTKNKADIEQLGKDITKEAEDRAKAVKDEEDARKAADLEITNKIGAVEGTVAEAIAAAQNAAAQDAAAKVKALEDGQVATNKADVAQNKADIEQLEKDLAAEANAREDEDKAIDARLDKVEAFFEGAYGEDGKSLNEALDTLVEIQTMLDGDGEAAGNLIGRVADAEKDIDDLEKEFADGGRVTKAEADLRAVEGEVDTLQSITKGYTAEGSIAAAIKDAQDQADLGVANAATAQAAAEAADGKAVQAQKEVDALEEVVAGVRTTAEDAQSRVAAVEPLVEQAGKDIDALEAEVFTGDDSNANLRSAITNLQTLTGDAAKGNEALHTELTRVAGLVDNTTTGLAATKVIADRADAKSVDNANRIKAIEDDYLKKADVYVFNCGSSTTVTHEAEA